MAESQPPEKYYQAYLTTELVEGPRTPIRGERIVVVLGEDEETGLPLELSISLCKRSDRSLSIYAIKEPVLAKGKGKPSFPDLVVEEVPAVNVRRVSVRYKTIPENHTA